LASAAGLHCANIMSAFEAEPLLAPVEGASRTLEALHRSGLAGCELSPGADTGLRRLVCRTFERAQPRRLLNDVREFRIRLDRDDWSPQEASGRAALIGLVVGAADLAFLALPEDLHQPWAQLFHDSTLRWVGRDSARSTSKRPTGHTASVGSRHSRSSEGSDRYFSPVAPSHEMQSPPRSSKGRSAPDMGARYLLGLIEVVALPVFAALHALPNAEAPLAGPLEQLRCNAKHWKATPLTAPAKTESTRQVTTLAAPSQVVDAWTAITPLPGSAVMPQ